MDPATPANVPAAAAPAQAQTPANVPAAAAPAQAQAPAPAPAIAQPPAATQGAQGTPPAQPALPPALAALLQGQPVGGLAVGIVPAAPAAPVQPPAVPAAPPASATPAAPAQPPAAPAAAPRGDDQVVRLQAQVNATAIRDAIKTVADKAGAINPDQVVKLYADDFDVDATGRVFVRADPRADVQRYVAQQLAANLHLLKPAVPTGGSGASATVQPPGAAQQAPSPRTAEGGTLVVQRTMASLLLPNATAPAAQMPPASR